MEGREGAFEIITYAERLSRAKGLSGTILLRGQELSTLRSARNFLHQPTIARDQSLKISVSDEKSRTGSATTSSLSREAIGESFKEAEQLVLCGEPYPYVAELISQPKELPEDHIDGWDEETAGGETKQREKFFKEARKAVDRLGLLASARFYTGNMETAVGNTLGLLRYHRFTISSCELTMTGIPSTNLKHISAFAARSARDVRSIDYNEVIQEAVESAILQKHLPIVDPFSKKRKRYKELDVILRPYALATWLMWLNWYAFNGDALFNETSVLTGKIGQLVASQATSIADDWRYDRMIPAPFDAEGLTRTRVLIIEEGIARGVVCGGVASKRSGLTRTGHAMMNDYTWPLHLVFKGDNYTLDDLIESCERPTLLITSFNYPSMSNTREGVFTGTTRHGTFLIEGGKIRGIVPPLRFIERTLDAFSRIYMKTEPMIVVEQDHYEGIEESSYAVPAAKIENFHFVGSVS